MNQTSGTHPDATTATSAVGLASLRFVRHRLQRTLAETADRTQRLAITAQTLTSAIGQECIVWVQASGDQVELLGLTLPAEGLARELRQALVTCAAESLRSGLTVSHPIANGVTAICAPITNVPHQGAFVVMFSGATESLPAAIAATEIAAASFAAAELGHETQTAAAEAADAGALVDLLARAESASELTPGCRQICTELRQYLDCHDVLIGVKAPDEHVITFTARALDESLEDKPRLHLEAAMFEALMQGEAVMFPPAAEGPRHALLAHRQFQAATSAGRLISTPLRTEEGTCHGALVIVEREARLPCQRVVRFLTAAEPRIAAGLSLLQRAERKGIERTVARLRSFSGNKLGRVVLGAVLAATLLMCVPLPYKVKARCELRPLRHRYVAAPFDGPLDECFVEPGDLVQAGQVLARLDGREIRLSLAEVASNRNRAAKERDMHRANREYGAAEMARLQMEAFEARRELLEFRGQNLEIRSPSDGVVVSGDWSKSEGVPLKTGETMFEIAPLDRMIVEVAIPEEDITHVAQNQRVSVRLDAYAGETWSGRLLRVHPASEVLDGEHIFIGEVELANEDLRLRPGMRGRVRIATPVKPLGWNLFHKPWNRLVEWLRFLI